MKKPTRMTEKDSTVETLILEFSKQLKSKGNERLAPAIANRFTEIFGKRIRRGKLITAFPLEEKKIEEISKMIFEKFHKKIHFTNVVDKHILGGIIIRFGDIVIDESIKNQLEAIKHTVYGHR